ncbi:MAG TPA: hypothetical protein GX736_03435 [Mogibacterium sp.]|nr:hypothetical protein [Mogibacterium sp.]
MSGKLNNNHPDAEKYLREFEELRIKFNSAYDAVVEKHGGVNKDTMRIITKEHHALVKELGVEIRVLKGKYRQVFK